jgi:NADH dehydrogenase
MAIIGRNAAAVNAFGRIRFTGFLAWVFWLALHLVYLAGFRNRTMVGINWICNYFFRAQQIRIISGSTPAEENGFPRQPEVATTVQPG